jgi:hypothetical protein
MGELPIEASLPQIWVDRDEDAARARDIIDYLLPQHPHRPARPLPQLRRGKPLIIRALLELRERPLAKM